MLLKGVTKFVHYKRDILSEEKREEIETKQEEFRELLKARDKEAVKEKAKELQKTCERSVPMPPHSGLRENVEVFFVAIVIALGIRSYFLQPFKIPTGSMQPTLNGIIAFGHGEDKDAEWAKVKTNPVSKAWNLFWHGRNFIDLRAKEDFLVTKVYQKNPFKFFSFTYIEREGLNGEKLKRLKLWSPMDKAFAPSDRGGLGLGEALGLNKTELGGNGVVDSQNHSIPQVTTGAMKKIRRNVVRKGTLLARGYVDTGDQVLVNKFSYHFRMPKRGEVFVFTTKGIPEIINRSPTRQSQHYIKRLCAVPGDTFEIRQPELFINEKRATEPGIVKVMDRDGGGYRRAVRDGRRFNQGKLEDKQYLALGDNSGHSWDSRSWGPVQEKNLVGPALFVYWPFAKHWGLIR